MCDNLHAVENSRRINEIRFLIQHFGRHTASNIPREFRFTLAKALSTSQQDFSLGTGTSGGFRVFCGMSL